MTGSEEISAVERPLPFRVARPVVTPERTPIAKRAFDIVLAAIGLAISLPAWALIAAAVKAEDGGPVVFRQPRVGQGGRIFEALKFRSMVPDADKRFGARQATEGDDRVTTVGRWLRRTAMDELPQLWNILRGDMSFVGPRALMPGEIEVRGDGVFEPIEAVPGFAERCRVRPGLTGVAQVFAPRDVPRRQKFRYDRLYVKRQSLAFDIRLVLVSFWISARGRWETRDPKF